MTNIRRDKTNYQPDRDQNNWTNQMWNNDRNSGRDAEIRQAMLERQNEIMNSTDEAAKADLMLARRIDAVTNGDTTASRVEQVQKELDAAKRLEEKLMAQIPQGESEEEFITRNESNWSFYRKAKEQARKEAGL